MYTNRRGKKKSDVVDKVSQIWNDNLSDLIESRYGSRKSFVEAYKAKYGVGNTADASRWVNVGGKASKDDIIGFPSYDTMRRIADFFGVTVGYLTGETDYKTFEMERACEYLGIDQTTGEAISRITKLKYATRFEKYEKINYGKALCCLLSADKFEEFIGGLCQYAEAAYQQANPIKHMTSPEILSIQSEVLDLAIKYKGIFYEEEVDNPSEITDEVIAAIHAIEYAESKDFSQQIALEQNVKLAKYDLQERYFRLLEDILRPENLGVIQSHYYEPFSSIEELKQRIETVVVE